MDVLVLLLRWSCERYFLLNPPSPEPERRNAVKTLLMMPAVQECAAVSCSFNDGGCHAPAVTVASTDGAATCATFVESATRGGIADVTGTVGACARTECVHNTNLACTAEHISVGPGATASDCRTFQPV
jgi:hypothetical protein